MKFFSFLVLSLGLSLSAFGARLGGRPYCAWSNDVSVCDARPACRQNVRSPLCAKYCHANPRDVVCGEVYQPALRPTAPYYGDSPYPWARSGGGFCSNNPYNIGCQNDWWANGNDGWGFGF